MAVRVSVGPGVGHSVAHFGVIEQVVCLIYRQVHSEHAVASVYGSEMRRESVFVLVFVFVYSSVVPCVGQLVVADGVVEMMVVCRNYRKRHADEAVASVDGREMRAENVFVFVFVFVNSSIVP